MVTSNFLINERVVNRGDGLGIGLMTFRWRCVSDFAVKSVEDIMRNYRVYFILLSKKEEMINKLFNEIGHESSFLGHHMKTNIRDVIRYQDTWWYSEIHDQMDYEMDFFKKELGLYFSLE